MDQTLLHDYLARLEGLMRDGRELRALVASDQSSQSTLAAVRSWQQQSAETINELSGGTKAHWLARAFSEAFLVRSITGEVVEEAPVAEIVGRITGVLEQAARSLGQMSDAPTAVPAPASSPPRFDFVHNTALGPILQQAHRHGRAALEDGRYGVSLITMCSVLEAVITDALEHAGHNAHGWSFETRIDAAERAGLIRGSCARLPPVARNYRDLTGADGELLAHVTVTARDARVTSQVLQVVIRDLNPER